MRGFSQQQKRNWFVSVFAACIVGMSAGHVSSEPHSANQIRDVKIGQKGGKTVVTISGSMRPSFTAFKLNSPERLIIDIADSHVRGIPPIIEQGTPLIGGVAVSEYSVKGQPVCRVMINFKKSVAYRVRVQGNRLVASLSDTPTLHRDEKPSPLIEDALQAAREADQATARAEKEAARARKQAEKAKRLAVLETERARARAKSAGIKARAEAERAREDAIIARKEAAKARKEAEIARKEAEIANRRAQRLAEQARADAEQIKKQAESAVAQAHLAQKKATEETHAARAEAALARKQAANETHRIRKQAEAAIEKAETEAEQARKKAEQARREAEDQAAAQKTQAEKEKQLADAEIERAKTQIADLKERETALNAKLQQAIEQVKKSKQRMIEARSEAKNARASYEIALQNQKKRDLAADRYKAEKLQENEQLISKYRTLVSRSEKQAEQEKLKRQKLEQRVNLLSKKLLVAENATKNAETALIRAEKKADELKKEAVRQSKNALSAEKEAQRAMAAQRKATENYQKAAKDEKQRLLAVLKQAEMETVEAERKLEETQRSRNQAKQSLARALKTVADAKGEAQEAAKAQSQMEERTKWELARWKQRVAIAENSMASALKEAEEARLRERQAIAKAAEIRQRAEEMRREAIRKADRQVAEAKKRLQEAELAQKQAKTREQKSETLVARVQAEAKEAEARSIDLKNRVVKAEKDAANATKRAQKIEQDLAKAKMVIAKQEEKIAALAERERQAAAKTIVKKESELTQEELRLQRLAKLRGEKPPVFHKLDITPPVSKGKNQIKDIEFKVDGNTQKIVISTSNPIIYSTTTDNNGRATMILKGAKLAPILERTLDVTDFGGLIGTVSSYQKSNNIKIEVDVNRLAENSVTHNRNVIEWTFVPKAENKLETRTGNNNTRVAGPVPPQGTSTRTIAREDSRAYAHPFERTAALSAKSKKKKKKRYTGRHIDLDFKDADIHNILRLLSDVGRVNIITADDVRGSVTIRMRDVAWDHALDVILQAKHLGMVREGNLIRVAPEETLEKERELEIARRKQEIQLEPLETRLIPVSYAEASELLPQANSLITERGSLSVDNRTNVIIARDTRSGLNQVEALIRNLDTQTPQVLIESRIVEATSQYAREIGIQWGGDFTASSATGNPTGLAFPSSIGVAGGATDSQTPIAGLTPFPGGLANPNFAVNLPAAVGTGSGGALGITLGSIANNANLSLRLSAMEETGTLRILSSPKILTLDNREAHIEQGTLIPYSQISAQGVQTAFKEAKLNLTVKPHVTADGSVLIALKVMRDEPDFNNTGARGDPTILKREAETELLVSDGHTAVIGGIFTRNHGTSYKKVPFFGDIPILGWLFKNRSDSDRRSEMLIFITPRIVNRAESIGQ